MNSSLSGFLRRTWKPVLGLVAAAAIAPLIVNAQAEKKEGEAQFITNARQLTFEGARAGEGYFHPEGNLLVFQSEREVGNPFYQIYLLDLLSGESARVSPGQGKTTCAFFQPGSSRLLFASTHADSQSAEKQKAELEFRASGKQRRYAWDYDEHYDIWSCNQDGTQLVQLTKEQGYDAEASYSPDGKQIVFCSMRSAFPADGKLSDADKARREKDPAYFGDLYIMNADGSNVRRLTEAPGYDGGPFFSPDGERIIWRHFDESGMIADVWTMKTDGSDKRRVTDFGCMSWAPYYHPSGKYVIFTANKLGFDNFELFLVDVEGEHEPVRATFTDGFDGLPVFAPDGKRLCWTSNRTSDKKSQLFMADWNHEAALAAIEAAPLRAAKSATPATAPASAETSGKPSTTNAAAATAATVKLDEVPTPLSTDIKAEDLRSEISWLADPARGGRMTGTPGAEASAQFLAHYLQRIGFKPVGSDYFHSFQFDAGVRLVADRNQMSIVEKDASAAQSALALDTDWRPLAFSDSGEVEGEVIFAGYGLSVPDGQNGGRYNSYEGLDVKDKIVLVFRYVPEGVDPQRRAQLNRYAGLRYKAMLARERGAKAVLFVSGPNSPQAGELLPLTGDGSLAGSGVIAASISAKAADALLAGMGKTLKDLQSGLDNENPHATTSLAIPNRAVKLGVGVEHIKKSDRNVVAYLPAGDSALPPAPPAANSGHGDAGASDQLPPRTTGANPHEAPAYSGPEFILLGAHYDHLGNGVGSNSMARSGEEGKVHPGADDNASGVAAILEIAHALAKEREANPAKFRRGVMVGLWSGEEVGLIGSSGFAEKPPVDLKAVSAYVNFDMVGRMKDNKLTLQGIGSSTLWKKLIEKRNVAAGFSLALQDDPYLPTDTTAFYPKRIPVLNFFTGAHEDYHRPTDTADKINYEGAERIAKFAERIVLDLTSSAEKPDFARVERSDQGGGSRETLRAYLGTIPDYTTEVKGVKLSGVRGGSPAEKAGIQGGDVLVEFAGQKIANIYDYTYALDAVKIGQPVKIVVERNGQKVELTATPEARK